MPRRRGYGYSSSRIALKKAQFEEIDRAEFLDLVLVAYSVADGDMNDIATLAERRLAIFRKEGFPEDPYEIDQTNSYGSFDGLPKAEIDELLDPLKERDEEALKHRNDSEQLVARKDDEYYRAVDKVTFTDFLEAVNKVKTDDNDEEAWATIDRWRTRRMQNEKVI